MIAYLKGKVLQKEENHIILLVDNVGYQVYLSERELRQVAVNSELELYIHHHIREDNQALYGFQSLIERRVFLLITSVSGIGPRIGLAVLSQYTPEQVVQYINRGDVAALNAISGVGKRIAEKVIVELKDKVQKLFPDIESAKGAKGGGFSLAGDGLEQGFKDEIQMALSSLGYNSKEIDRAIQQNRERLTEVTTTEEAIKIILKNLH